MKHKQVDSTKTSRFKHKLESKHFPFYLLGLCLGLELGLGLGLGLGSNHPLASSSYISLYTTTPVAYYFIYMLFASIVTLTIMGEC